MPLFTENHLQRIMINPRSAITIARRLTAEHDPAMSEADWVQANASLIKEMGARQWLAHLLGALEDRDDVADERINPFRAVNIDPLFAAEHIPLIGREVWIDVNALQLRGRGREEWLRCLLDVLNGDIVTPEEVGIVSPVGSLFGYAAAGLCRERCRGQNCPGG
ncbi:MAG TPA: hypothetical protein VGF67_00075 [Ktedonobacteraceae bacterium]|jgi:hypothetical protein